MKEAIRSAWMAKATSFPCTVITSIALYLCVFECRRSIRSNIYYYRSKQLVCFDRSEKLAESCSINNCIAFVEHQKIHELEHVADYLICLASSVSDPFAFDSSNFIMVCVLQTNRPPSIFVRHSLSPLGLMPISAYSTRSCSTYHPIFLGEDDATNLELQLFGTMRYESLMNDVIVTFSQC